MCNYNYNKDSFAQDKSLEIKLMPVIKGLLGRCLGVPEYTLKSDTYEDVYHNTDILCNRGDGKTIRIDIRIRRFNAFQLWPREFTIRCERDSGAETELSKIMRGWGDLYCYAFANAIETDIIYWFIGNLDTFRLYINYYIDRNGLVSLFDRIERKGSALFIPFLQDEVLSVLPGFVLADTNRWTGGRIV